jgi:hypothetical protein
MSAVFEFHLAAREHAIRLARPAGWQGTGLGNGSA